ncbi:DUF6383 domain-containing protein [Parabacteroides chinchillae]
MNKRFSTLLAAFAALTVVSTAQTKYVQLVNGQEGALTWSKDVPTVDSVKFVDPASFTTKAENDSALWEVKIVSIESVSGDTVCTFTNKAAQQMLSFAKSQTATTKIAAGVNQFVYKKGAIYASIGDNKYIALKSGGVVGTSVTDTTQVIETAAPEIQIATPAELTGFATSFQFSFAGKDGGLFTATELIPTLAPGTNNKIKFQVVGSENSTDGTKPAQYITIDTLSYSGNVKAPKFQKDTLVAAGTARYQGWGNSGLQAFTVMMNLGNDSIYLTTDSVVAYAPAATTYSIVEHGGSASTYLVGYKDLAGTKVLSIDSVQITAPFISVIKGTPVALDGGTGVYSLKFIGTGGNATNNGKYLTYKAAYNYDADAPSNYAAYTQMYVKDNENGTYSIQARESQAVTATTGANGETTGKAEAAELFTNKVIYSVKNAPAGVYAIENGAGVDTVLFTKMDVNMADKSVGYKYYTKEEMGYGAVAFKLISKAGDDVYLSTKQDSIITGAPVSFDGALQLRLSSSNANSVMDTVVYGALALGDTLMRVSYSMAKPYNAAANFYATSTGLTKMAVDADSIQRYFFVADYSGEGYQIVKANIETVEADSAIVMNASTLDVAYGKQVASNSTLFAIEGGQAPTYAKVARGHYNISMGYDMLTNVEGAAKFMRVNDELKAALTADDFALYIDTAYVDRGSDNTNYGYYIYKGATVDNDTVIGNALTIGGAAQGLAVAGDSALFVATRVVKDSIWYAATKANEPIQVTSANNKSVMMFKVVGDAYVITPMNVPSKTLSVVNGTVIFSSDADVAAQPITFETASTPTGNEGIDADNTISVVAGEGNVTVYGAAGKKVVVSNVLGQKTTIVATSDSEVIAAPQGVVIVAVEGEAAVKAVVK